MKQSSQYLLPFLLAVTLHGAGGYYAGRHLFPQSTIIRPQFASGHSSMELTLLSPVSLDKQIDDSATLHDLNIDDMPLQVLEEPDNKDEPNNKEADADLLDKGVEGLPAAQTFVRPRYPYGSKIRGEQGTVTIRVTLDDSGKPRLVDILESSGYRSLDNAAINAAKETVYVSQGGGSVGGREVECKFRFELKD